MVGSKSGTIYGFEVAGLFMTVCCDTDTQVQAVQVLGI